MSEIGNSVAQWKFHFCHVRGSERKQQEKMAITHNEKYMSCQRERGRRTCRGGDEEIG